MFFFNNDYVKSESWHLFFMLPRPRIHTNFDISGVDLVFNIAPIHKIKYGKKNAL